MVQLSSPMSPSRSWMTSITSAMLTLPSACTTKTTQMTMITSISSWYDPQTVSFMILFCKKKKSDQDSSAVSVSDFRCILYNFQDDKVFCYYNHTLEDGYPKEIQEDFPGIPTHLDAAVECPGGECMTDSVLFFKGMLAFSAKIFLLQSQYHNFPLAKKNGIISV